MYRPHCVAFDSLLKQRRNLALASRKTARDTSPSTVHGGSGTKPLSVGDADQAPSIT